MEFASIKDYMILSGKDLLRFSSIYSSIATGLFFLFFSFAYPGKTFKIIAIPFSVTLGTDKLSIFFVALISLVSIFVSVFSLKYGEHYKDKPHIFFLCFIFILSMIFVVMSRDIITFLIFWELMSLSSFFLVMSEGNRESKKVAGFYFLMTHIGTVLISSGFILLYLKTSSLSFGHYSNMADILILIVMITGFSIKSGIFPFHVWLPQAHPVSPSHVSALMSGLMVNVAIYGVLRVLFIFGFKNYPFLGISLLIFGAVTAFFGIMYALVQKDIKKVLAFSTVENVGIIYMGIGLSYWAYVGGHKTIETIALLAVLLHILNHALSKSALFMGSGVISENTGTKNMEELGGLAKNSVLFSVLFLIAAMSISAMPPLNSFVSEWYLYTSLIGAARVHNIFIEYFSVISIAMLSVTGALAGAAFAKLYGITFLGKYRSKKSQNAVSKISMLENISIAFPVLLCVIIGVYPYPLISEIGKLIRFISSGTARHPVSIFFLSAQTAKGYSYSAYFPMVLIVSLMFLVVVTFFAIKYLAAGKTRKLKTWACGLEEENRFAQISGSGFSYGIMRVFSTFYSKVSEKKFDAENKKYFRNNTYYSEEIGDIIEKKVYLPVKKIVLAVSAVIGRLFETNSINMSLGFIFLALVSCFVIYLFIAG